METRTVFLSKAVLVGLLVGLVIQTGWADPRQWNGEHGLFVRQGTYVGRDWSAAQDSSGNTLVVWADMHTSHRNVYAQLLNADGAPRWDSIGVVVASTTDVQLYPVVVAVDGGWFIAWVQNSSGEWNHFMGDARAQKLDNTGARLWPDNNFAGVIVVADPNQAVGGALQVVHDGLGGAFVVWQNYIYSSSDILAQRVNSDGSLAWTDPVAVADATGGQLNPSCVNDGSGNLLLAWYDERDSQTPRIYAAKLTAAGELPWTVQGVRVFGITAYSEPDLSADGAGGCYIGATTGPTQNYIRRIQRLNADGQAQWVLDGISVATTHSYDHTFRVMASDSAGTTDGCLTVWEDRRIDSNYPEICAQKVSPGGVERWTTGGLCVSGNTPGADTLIHREPSVTSDHLGGLVCAWTLAINPGSESDIYAARVTAAGILPWAAEGVVVSDMPQEQIRPLTLCAGPDGMSVLWMDDQYPSVGIRYQSLAMADGARSLPAAGEDIRSGITTDAVNPVCFGMGEGRVATVWRDYRLGDIGNQLYYQITDSTGSIERALNGEPLAPDNENYRLRNQEKAAVCTDGAGGFFVSFEDQRFNDKRIRLQRINSAGEIACSQAAVMAFDDEASADQIDAYCAPDGAGGTFLAWSNNTRGFQMDVYLMRMNSNCQPMWLQPVRLTNTIPDDQMQGLVPSTNGSSIVVWRSGDQGQYDLQSAQVSGGGTVLWTHTVCDSANDQDFADVVPDGNNGAYIAWADSRGPSRYPNIYAQHLTAEGVSAWTPGGVPVCTADSGQSHPRLCTAPDGSIYLAWEDYRTYRHIDLYVQKLNPQSTSLWDANGRGLAVGTSDQYDLRLLSDRLSGLFAVWVDKRGTFPWIGGTHLDSLGQTAWDNYWLPDSGNMISDSGEWRSGPSLVEDGKGAYVIAWTQSEPDGDYVTRDIRAQRISDGIMPAQPRDPATPARFALEQNYPNPFNPVTEIAFSVSKAGEVSLRVFDLLGRQVATLHHGPLTAGEHRVSFDATDLASGVYFYRLESGDLHLSRKMVLLK
jgi:hypothetical protein